MAVVLLVAVLAAAQLCVVNPLACKCVPQS